MHQSRGTLWAVRGSRINTGHVEKTNDRDYEVEERYGSRRLVNRADIL